MVARLPPAHSRRPFCLSSHLPLHDTSSPSSLDARAASMATSSPPPLAPAAGTGAWGPYDSKRAFLNNVVITVGALGCVALLALAIFVVLYCRTKSAYSSSGIGAAAATGSEAAGVGGRTAVVARKEVKLAGGERSGELPA
ncbi:hypothetical protein ACP70R_014636 [Stipagrostis hirtigluma subsp. patula]